MTDDLDQYFANNNFAFRISALEKQLSKEKDHFEKEIDILKRSIITLQTCINSLHDEISQIRYLKQCEISQIRYLKQ